MEFFVGMSFLVGVIVCSSAKVLRNGPVVVEHKKLPGVSLTYPHQCIFMLVVKVTVFYLIFYACLAGWFAGLLHAFYSSLDDIAPSYYGNSSLLQNNPGRYKIYNIICRHRCSYVAHHVSHCCWKPCADLELWFLQNNP